MTTGRTTSPLSFPCFKSNTAIIFVTSLFELVSVLRLLSIVRHQRIIIATTDYQIYISISHYAKSSLLLIVIEPFSSLSWDIGQFRRSIVSAKNTIHNNLGNFHNADVFFFTVSWGYEVLYAITLLSFSNNIYYFPPAEVASLASKKSFIASQAIKIIYNIKVQAYFFGHQLRTLVESEFLESVTATSIDRTSMESIPISSLFASSPISTKFNHTHSLILLSDLEELQCSLDQYNKYLDLLSYLVSLIPSVLFKPHPLTDLNFIERFTKDYPFLETSSLLPKAIPASSMISSLKVLIGYSSATLIEASSLEGIVIISLINCLSYPSREPAETYLNANCRQSSAILYPYQNDLSELLVDLR